MTASLMIVSYNRLDLTKQTLDSLFLEQNTQYPFRLIIIDNNSTDGTIDYLKSLSVSCKYLQDIHIQYNQSNLGIAVGRNQALVVANKFNDPYLSTADNDVKMPDGWLAEAVDIINFNPNFMIGVNMEGGNPYPPITLNKKTFQLKPRGNAGTACTVFKRELHTKIGFFNTEYGAYSCEDSDYGWRLRLAGYKIGYITRMGTHLGENEVGEYREWKTECHKKTLAQFQQNCALYASGKKSIYIPFNG